jgi:hypothetical protein
VAAERRAPLWRGFLSWIFLLVFCLTLPAALLTGWARLAAVDTDAFGGAMASLAADGRIQGAVRRVVAARVAANVSGDNPTATEALQSRVVGEVVSQAMSGVVESTEFRDIWASTTAGAHQLLATNPADNQGQPVVLDFTPLYDNIEAEIASLDLELPPDFAFDVENLRIQVFDAPTADRIREAAALVDRVFVLSIGITAAALALALWLAPDRLAALTRVGFGLTLAMVVLIALLLAIQGWVMGETGPEGGAAMAGVILDAISQGVRVAAVGMALLGLLLTGMFAAMRALAGGTIRRVPAASDA